MITQDTHRIDWHKTARTGGTVLLALGKALWWLTKNGGLLLIAIAAILGKVFTVLVSVWASMPEPEAKSESAELDYGYNHLGEWVEGGMYSVPPDSK